jgi:hypothetical protein
VGFFLSAFSGIVLEKSRILLLQKLLYPRAADEKVAELMTLIRQGLKYVDKPGNSTRQDE